MSSLKQGVLVQDANERLRVREVDGKFWVENMIHSFAFDADFWIKLKVCDSKEEAISYFVHEHERRVR